MDWVGDPRRLHRGSRTLTFEGGVMANGIEQDVRDIRREVSEIQRDGCGHKTAHDKGISDLWGTVETIKKSQGELVRNVVLSVAGLVLALMIANFFVTKQTIATMVKDTETSAAAIAAENRVLLQEIRKDIKNGKVK